jgi:hypothetical protein
MKDKPYPKRTTFREPKELAAWAAKTLRQNDMGGWTKPAPGLYPHQWSWDSAFIAIGLAHLDSRRAARELSTLFDHQWVTGKVPHIVFDPKAPPGSYFPGADHWARVAAPVPPYTSGLCQPPVHAIAVSRIWETARGGREAAFARAFLCEIYPKLFSWHRYLATSRDPEESGLVTIYHPWESGTDNSPRWNAALAAVKIGDMAPYARCDLKHVADASQRPADADYNIYLWLVESIKRAGYDEDAIRRSHPFLVKDVLFSAILVAANEALLEIAEVAGAPEEERAQIQGWIERGQQGLEGRWNPELGLYLDHDVRADEPLRVRTVAGFAPLIAGHLSPERLETLLGTLDSPAFAGHPGLRWPLPPSTSPEDPGFDPCSYWRGPAWPVINWLLWWSLLRTGESERAERLRRAALAQLADGGFGEYFDPFTGRSLGSADQSWTAAVALDWLASGPQPEVKAA